MELANLSSACTRRVVLGSVEKTFIGGIEKEFDFLGYRFTPRSLTVARKTIENFLERAPRLYRQEPGGARGFPALQSYVTRWRRWATAGS